MHYQNLSMSESVQLVCLPWPQYRYIVDPKLLQDKDIHGRAQEVIDSRSHVLATAASRGGRSRAHDPTRIDHTHGLRSLVYSIFATRQTVSQLTVRDATHPSQTGYASSTEPHSKEAHEKASTRSPRQSISVGHEYRAAIIRMIAQQISTASRHSQARRREVPYLTTSLRCNASWWNQLRTALPTTT